MMRCHKSLKRLSYFQAYLVSYIVLVMLVLCTLIPYISNTLTSFDKRAEEKFRTTITQTLDKLDTTLSNIETMLMSNENDAFSELYRLGSHLQTRDYYTMRKATQYLRTIVYSNPSISDLFFTYPDIGITLRAEGGFDSVQAFNRYYNNDDFYDQIFLHKTEPYYVSSRSIAYGGLITTEDVFGYCFNLNRNRNIKAFILIKTQDYLGNEMLQVLSGEGYAVLTDYRGNVIHEIGSMPEKDAAGRVTVECASNDGRFKLTANLPRTRLSNTSLEIITLLLVCLLTSLAVGSFYAWLSARRHARPVEKLITDLNSYNQQIRANETRMVAMQNVMDNLQQENEQFSMQMENFLRTRRENTVTRLFTSVNLSTDDIEYFHKNFDMLPQRFCVAYGRVAESELNTGYPDEMSMIFVNMLRQQLPSQCLIYLPDARSIAVLLDEDEPYQRDVLIESFPDISWSFSHTYHDEHCVASALEEARMLYEFRDQKLLCISMQSVQRIYQHLLAGNSAGAEQQLQDIFCAVDPENIRYVSDGLRFIIYMVASEQGLSTLVPPLSRQMTCEDLFEALREAMNRQCEQIQSRKKSRNEERRNQVLCYIQTHHTDSMLCAPMIAEQMGISEKYLYNFVKEQTGCSLGDYLLQLRMNKAVDMLQSNKSTIKEICYAVGFCSENSFYKAFKRMYGITPTQYRASAQN